MALDLKLWLVGVCALGAVACSHKVGDSCKTSVDCSQAGERLCDITQPGGYCTIFNCEPDSCPSEAACVVFDASLSSNSAAACMDSNGLSRFARSFCLFKCSSNDDCRDDYVCEDFSPSKQPNAWSALVVDSESNKVCVVNRNKKPDSQSELPPELMGDNVCSGSSTGGSSGISSGGSGGMSSGGSGGVSSGGSAGAAGSDAGAGAGSGGG